MFFKELNEFRKGRKDFELQDDKFNSEEESWWDRNKFMKMNEMESKPAETRLNYFKNFNHINKDQLGAMDIFGPRSNNEVQRMNDEIFDHEPNEEDVQMPFDHLDDFDYPQDSEQGLEIGTGDTIQRFHSYPYGFNSPPSPTYRMGSGIQSTSLPIVTFEEFNWKGVPIVGKELDRQFVERVTKDLPQGSRILDIGYGDGAEMEYLASKGFEVYGTEIKEDYKDNLKNSTHVTHDMRDLFPFKDNYFDFVYCRLSLHYFEKDEVIRIMKEINRITKNHFAFTCKTSGGNFKTGKKFYTLEEWVEMTTHSGFNVYSSEDKTGKLYGHDSTWVEVYSNKRN